MTLAERLLSRRGILIVGLPATGRSSFLASAASDLTVLGSVILISGIAVDPHAFATALDALAGDANQDLLQALGQTATGKEEKAEVIFLLVDDLGRLLRSGVGDRIDQLLGTITFGDPESGGPDVFTAGSLLRGEHISSEESVCFTDRAASVYIGQSEAPLPAVPDLRAFGEWPGLARTYRSDPVAGLGRARSALRSHLLRRLVAALTLEDMELVFSVLRRQQGKQPRRWDPVKYVGLAPLVVVRDNRAIVPEEFVRAGIMGVLDLRHACRRDLRDPRPRARWLASRCVDEVSPLWWDGHFGEQGTRPMVFLTWLMKELGQALPLRILVHQDAVASQPRRFAELKTAIETEKLLMNLVVRSTPIGRQQGLHDRQLYLPSLRRVVKLPIYTRLAGPSDPGDYTETWIQNRVRFDEGYDITERAFQKATPLQ